MKKEKIKACILRIEGTNCEEEMQRGFTNLGVNAELVHLKQLIGGAGVTKENKRDLFDYQILMFPGGFSAGDYVMAGAIWSAWMKSKLSKKLGEFVKEERAVGGVCNGFQVLTQLGLLPGTVQAALATNSSAKFECRPVYLRHENKCAFTEKIEKDSVLNFPIGHAEGRFTFLPGKEQDSLRELEQNNQIVFKYTKLNGNLPHGEYPYNPNGAYSDIAGIRNLDGNVFGLMPHPERVLERFEHYDWTRSGKDPNSKGDGQIIFESVVEYVKREL